MGIDAAQGNPRVIIPCCPQHLIRELQHLIRPFRRNQLHSLDQPDMGRQVNNLEAAGGQHHREILRLCQLGQNFGMSGIEMPSLMQRLLIQRGGTNGLDFTGLRQLNSLGNIMEGGISRRCGQLPERNGIRQKLQADAINNPMLEKRLSGSFYRANLHCIPAGDGSRPLQCFGVTDNERAAHLINIWMR